MTDRKKGSLKLRYSLKDLLYILIFIAQFMMIYWLSVSPLMTGIKTIITLLLALGMFFVTIYWYQEPLKTQWRDFRKNNFWKKIIIAIILMLGIYLILQVTRSLIPASWLGRGASVGDDEQFLSLLTIIVSLVTPLLAPFTEEVLFRYILIGKASGRGLKIVMLVVQAILFGLIHTLNFGGNPLATIPYMVVALYFGVIYLVSKNIWMTIIIHFLFNATTVLMPFMFLIMMLFK